MAVPIKDSQSGRFAKGQFSSKKYTVRLKPKHEEVFNRICAEQERIPTELIREIIEQWIEAQKKAPNIEGE